MSRTYNIIEAIENRLTDYFGNDATVEQWLPDANLIDPLERLAQHAMINSIPGIFIMPENSEATTKGERAPVPYDLQTVTIIIFVPMTTYETNTLALLTVEDKVKAALIAFNIPNDDGKKRIGLQLGKTNRANTAYGSDYVLQSMINYKFGIIIDGTIDTDTVD